MIAYNNTTTAHFSSQLNFSLAKVLISIPNLNLIEIQYIMLCGRGGETYSNAYDLF